jgi:hypothetical protein
VSERHVIDLAHPPLVDPEREWAVYVCAHGCFHVTFNRVMFTLTEAEFGALQDLLRQAWLRFHTPGVQGVAAGRSH